MKQKTAAVYIFYADDGRILLQDREGYSKWGEEWAVPGGGLEEGETPEQALIREVKEECCFDLDEYIYIGKTEHKYPDYHFTAHIFMVPLGDKQSQFTITEGKGLSLFTLAEARQLKTPVTNAAVFDLIEEYLQALPAMKHKPCVLALFYNKQKQVLVQDRRGISKWGEEWSFFGGHVESGETGSEAFLREMREELTFTPVDYTSLGENENFSRGTIWHRYIYAIPFESTAQFIQLEGENMALVSLEQLRTLKMPEGMGIVIDRLEQYLNASNERSPQE